MFQLVSFKKFHEFLFRHLRHLLIFVFVFVTALQVLADTLAEKLLNELGKNPSRVELFKALKKYAPKDLNVTPDDVLLPKEYTRIIFGDKLYAFIKAAQDTNPFLHKEANEYGFMVSEEVEEMQAWPFSPVTGQAFLVPRFEMPADKMQIGHLSSEEKMSNDLIDQVVYKKHGTGKEYTSVWVHPDAPEQYSDFIEGGAKNTPKDGYGVIWDYVGIAPNGPRSIMMNNFKHPDWQTLWVKVNLHRKLEGSVRLIPPHKAARSILATRLLQENFSKSEKMRLGFDFMPEIAAVALPYSRRSNVVRDPSLLKTPGTRYVYAYSAFSPVGVESADEILAVKWLGKNPSKAKLEKLARRVFRMMALPFAYNALVTGLNFEWHSANWLIKANDKEPLDKVLLQDMEALRYDPQIGIWNGGTATSLQAVEDPWLLAKYSRAIGGNWETHIVKEESVDIQAPEFLAEEYLWRVRGLKETSDPRTPTSIKNMWGYSTIVDVVRNFGIGVMGYNLKNEEVERWMDEEMADAFNTILRDELKISEDIVPDVTADQILQEVKLTVKYKSVQYGDKIPKGVEKVFDRIHKEGGITRALWQVRQHLNEKISAIEYDPDLQNLLAREAERLFKLHRNTRKGWSDLQRDAGIYFIFHEASRVIELRNEEGEWVSFFSLQHDGSPGTIKFFEKYKQIKGHYPASITKAYLNSCKSILASGDKLEREAPFGERSTVK